MSAMAHNLLYAIDNHHHCSASGGSVGGNIHRTIYSISARYATSKVCVEKENVLEISTAVGVYISHTIDPSPCIPRECVLVSILFH